MEEEDMEPLGLEERLPHTDPAHICHRWCYAWEDPEWDWPESCGDED